MTKDDLKNQLKTYWIVNFKNYYRVQYYCVQNYLWLQWGKRWQERPDFPTDELTHEERNSLFWNTLGIPKHSQKKARKIDESLAETKRIVREYQEPIPEKYTGRFAFAFYKL